MHLRLALAAVLVVSGLCASPLAAQKIYRWTDANGVVHFGHAPPRGEVAEEQRLPPPKKPKPPVEVEETSEAQDSDEVGEDTETQQSDDNSEPAAPAAAVADYDTATT